MENLLAFIVYIIIPFIGIAGYALLVRKIENELIEEPPKMEYFFVFATYGNALLLCLIALFLPWSGMASLGVFYMFFIAPIVMGIVYHRTNAKRELSRFHRFAKKISALYFIALPLLFLILLAGFFNR